MDINERIKKAGLDVATAEEAVSCGIYSSKEEFLTEMLATSSAFGKDVADRSFQAQLRSVVDTLRVKTIGAMMLSKVPGFEKVKHIAIVLNGPKRLGMLTNGRIFVPFVLHTVPRRPSGRVPWLEYKVPQAGVSPVITLSHIMNYPITVIKDAAIRAVQLCPIGAPWEQVDSFPAPEDSFKDEELKIIMKNTMFVERTDEGVVDGG